MSAAPVTPSAARAPAVAAGRGAAPARRPTAFSPRRVGALARAETLLLLRNGTALFNAVAISPLFVLFFATISGTLGPDAEPDVAGPLILQQLAAMSLLFVVYYNLTTTYVARRQELVLKRLLTGECSRAELLLAAAVPALLVTAVQLVLGYLAVALLLAPPPSTNPVLPLLGLLLVTPALVLLAAATSGVSRSVESAQLTTLPALAVLMVFSGVVAPGGSGGGFDAVARFTPMHAVAALFRLGLTGTDADGAALALGETFAQAALPVVVLVAWLGVAWYAARRWMRWEPQR
jgi:ABC-2 type transport system permease protein